MFFDDLGNKPANGGNKHPTSGWYYWKSGTLGVEKGSKKKVRIEDGYFKVRDREISDERYFGLKEMPKEFVVISESRSLGGYVKSRKKPLWGPEVYDLTTEPVTALIGREKEVYHQGIWSTFRKEAKGMGIELYRNLHCFDPENPDKMFTICLKGQASYEWGSTFSDANSYAFMNKRISFGDEKEMSNGGTDFTIPTFKIASPLTDEDRARRTEFIKELREYHSASKQMAQEEEAYVEDAPAEETPSIADTIKEKNETEVSEYDLPF